VKEGNRDAKSRPTKIVCASAAVPPYVAQILPFTAQYASLYSTEFSSQQPYIMCRSISQKQFRVEPYVLS